MAFDAEKVKNDIVQWIRDWFEENGKGCKAVIGISGGKDSSVVAALCTEALGKENVFGVMMPNGEQFDIDVSKALVAHLGIDSVVFNIKEAYDGVVAELMRHFDTFSDQAKTNLPPRLRMAVLYAVSQNINGRVANTCNLSEDWVGYSTRYGDSVGDHLQMTIPGVDIVDLVHLDILCQADVERIFTFHLISKEYKWQIIHHFDRQR